VEAISSRPRRWVWASGAPHVAELLREALATRRPVLDVPLRIGQLVTDAGDDRSW
jgi:hypothetical protein